MYCLDDVPSRKDIRLLQIEVYVMLACYVVTLAFTLYNVFAFVIKQRRYKNWLISIFYVLCLLVLIFRIGYYCEVNVWYSLSNELRTAIATQTGLQEVVLRLIQSLRLIGVFFLASDYTKYALGFFQLASMAELTIVIRQSVSFFKLSRRRELHKTRNRNSIGTVDEVLDDGEVCTPEQALARDKKLQRYLLSVKVVCAIFALACFSCGLY